jgi:hypothetical protein
MRHLILFLIIPLAACMPRPAPQPTVDYRTIKLSQEIDALEERGRKQRLLTQECRAKANAQKPYRYTAFDDCFDDRMLAILEEAGDPNIDLWRLKFKKDYLVLAKLQKGVIAIPEAETMLSENLVELNNMKGMRNAVREQQGREYDRENFPPPQMPTSVECTSAAYGGAIHTTCE